MSQNPGSAFPPSPGCPGDSFCSGNERTRRTVSLANTWACWPQSQSTDPGVLSQLTSKEASSRSSRSLLFQASTPSRGWLRTLGETVSEPRADSLVEVVHASLCCAPCAQSHLCPGALGLIQRLPGAALAGVHFRGAHSVPASTAQSLRRDWATAKTKMPDGSAPAEVF